MTAALALSLALVLPAQETKPLPNPLGKQFVKGLNYMGLTVLDNRLEVQPEKNILVSPTSIFLAMGLACNGAKGRAQQELMSACGDRNMTLETLNNYSQVLANLLVADRPGVNVSLANAIWLDKDYTYVPDFLKKASENFRADARTDDFHSDKLPEKINAWVSEKTVGKIPHLIDDKAVLAAVPAVLINAVYFRGDWRHPFDPKNSSEGEFNSPTGKEKTVMMHRSGIMFYGESEVAQMVELSYGDGKVVMDIILPKPRVDIPTLIRESLAGQDLLPTTVRSTGVTLTLPRFKTEFAANINGDLKLLGLNVATTDKADFSGLSNAPRFFLSKVYHKTVIEVNEKGTEAAATTAIEGPKGGPPAASRIFTCDRPFLYLIRDAITNAILFIGVLNHVGPEVKAGID